MEDKELFRGIIRENVKREGVSELLEWLESTDFFEAPASTKYHGVCPGGLLRHSLRVCYFLTILPEAAEYSMETKVICGLLHDLCKVGFYHRVGGKWEIRDELPMGHGEKSVYLIQKHMKLTDEEALAIRWHMGEYDDAFRGGSRALGQARDMCPLVQALHRADMWATKEEKSQEGL